MEAYQQDELADSEKDAKRIKEAEKAVKLKNHCKRKQGSDKEKMDPQQPSGFRPLQFSGSYGFPAPVPFMSPPFNQPVPFSRPADPAVKVPVPCFQCLQMGHLKAASYKTRNAETGNETKRNETAKNYYSLLSNSYHTYW